MGLRSLGVNHLEDVMRTLAFPLGEVGTLRVLRRESLDLTGPDSGFTRTCPTGCRGQKRDQRRGGCHSLEEDDRGRGQRWVVKKVVRTSPILDLF